MSEIARCIIKHERGEFSAIDNGRLSLAGDSGRLDDKIATRRTLERESKRHPATGDVSTDAMMVLHWLMCGGGTKETGGCPEGCRPFLLRATICEALEGVRYSDCEAGTSWWATAQALQMSCRSAPFGVSFPQARRLLNRSRPSAGYAHRV